MKKFLLLLATSALLASCNLNPTPTSTSTVESTEEPPVVVVDDSSSEAGPKQVESPVADVAYKMGLVLTPAEGEPYIGWLTGEMDGYYFATSADSAAAIDFMLKEVDGGFNMMCGDKYVNIVSSGKYNNVKYEDAASSVWSWNETISSYQTTTSAGTFGLGTQIAKHYVTVSAVAEKYFNPETNSFAHFYTLG